MNKKWTSVGLLLFVAVFGFMLLWYTQVHPFVPFDGDDWGFTVHERAALPDVSTWNPTRLLPEKLMPLCGDIAAFCIRPLMGDYVGALILTIALAASAAVAVYVAAFYRFLRRRLELLPWPAFAVSALFLALHFLALRSKPTGNDYVLGGMTPAIMFFYLIPTLLNGALVLYFEAEADPASFWSGKHLSRKGALVVAVYFAICSNMYCSILLAVYAGVRLLMSLAGRVRGRTLHIDGAFVRENGGRLLLLVGWLTSILIEYRGGRSRNLRKGNTGFPVAATARTFLASLKNVNRPFLAAAVGVTLVAIVLLALRRRRRDQLDRRLADCLGMALASGILVLIYIILLATVVNRQDVTMPQIWSVLLFFPLIACCAAVAALLRRFPRLMLCFPLLALVLVSCISTTGSTFQDGTFGHMDASVCRAVDTYMIDAIVAADQAGETALDLHVPASDDPINGPISYNVGKALSYISHKHGLTSRRIEVTIVPDPLVNERFFLDAHASR